MMRPPDPLYIFKGDMGPVFCLSYKKAKDKPILYVGTQNGIVHVWELKNNKKIGNFESSKESCISIHVVNEPSEIITQDKMGVIRFWLEEGFNWAILKEITSDYYGFCKSLLWKDIFYFPSKKEGVEGLCVKTKEKINNYSFSVDDHAITCLKMFDINSESFALVSLETCDLKLYQLEKGMVLSSLKVEEYPMALDFNVSIMVGACGGPTEKLLVFKLNKNYMLEEKKIIILRNPGVASLSIRPDGRLLAVGCWDGKLRLYSLKNLTILAVLDIHITTIQSVTFLEVEKPDGKLKFYLAAGSTDCKVSLWDLYN